MTDQTSPQPTDKTEASVPRQPSREAKKPSRLNKWFKRLVLLALLCVCVVVGLYFYATSATFFEQWVRPAAEEMLGRDVKVGTYALSPMSGITLENVEIAALEGEAAPALELKKLEFVYNLRALFSKRLEVSGFTLDSLTVRIRQNPDGTITGPFPLSTGEKPKIKKKEKKETSLDNLGELPIGLDIRNVKVSNLNIEFDRYSKAGGEPDRFRIKDLNASAPEITLDKDSTISLSAGLMAQLAEAPSTQTEPLVSGKLSIETTLQAKDGLVSGLIINSRTGDLKGIIEGWDISPYAVEKKFNLKITGPTALSIHQDAIIMADGKDISKNTFDAHFDVADMSGDIALHIPPMDRRALNLIGAIAGVDFRDTKVSADVAVKIAPQAQIDSAVVNLLVQNFNAIGGPIPKGDLPPLNVVLNLTANSTENGQLLNFQKFVLAVDRQMGGGKTESLLTASLKQPISLNPATLRPAKDLPAEAVEVVIQRLDLAEWSKFAPLPENITITKGLLSANLMLGSPDGKVDSVTLKGNVGLGGLSAKVDKDVIGPLNVALNLTADSAENAKIITLQAFNLAVDQQIAGDKRAPLLTASLKQPLSLNTATRLLTKDLPAEAVEVMVQGLDMAEWSKFAPLPENITITKGLLSANLMLGSPDGKVDSVTLKGNVGLGGLSAKVDKDIIGPLNVAFNLTADSAENAKIITLQAFNLAVDQQIAGSKKSPLLTASLKQPLSLNTATRLLAKDLPAEAVEVIVQGLDLAAWSKLAPLPENITIAKGLLSANLMLGSPDGKTKSFALKGNIGLGELSANVDKETIGPLSVATTLDVSGDEAMRITLGKCLVALSTQGKPVGTLSATGNLDANTLNGNFNIGLQGLSLDSFPASQLASVKEQISGARLNLICDVGLMMSADRISANGTATVDSAKVLDPAQKEAPPKALPPVAIDFNQTTDLKKMLVNLPEILITLGTVEKPEGKITVKGNLDLSNGLNGNLIARSSSINLVPLLAIAGITPAANAKPLVARNFGVDVTLTPETITATTFTVALAEGLITCEKFDLTLPTDDQKDPGLKWQGLNGQDIDVETVMTNVAPNAAGYLRGKAGFKGVGSARGFSPEAMQKSLRLTLDTFVRDGEIIDVPLAKELALVTSIDELKRIVFQRFDSHFQTTSEGIMVEKMEVVGIPQKIGITGKIGYDQALDLLLDLAIGDKLKAKTDGKSYTRFLKTDADGFLHFPTPLGVGGTASKPKVALKMSTGSILDLGTNALQNELLKKRQDDNAEESKPKSEKDKAKEDVENQLINLGSDLLKGFGK